MVITLWTVFPNFRFFPLLERIKMAIFRKFEIVLKIDLIMEVLNIGCRKFLVLNLLKIEYINWTDKQHGDLYVNKVVSQSSVSQSLHICILQEYAKWLSMHKTCRTKECHTYIASLSIFFHALITLYY